MDESSLPHRWIPLAWTSFRRLLGIVGSDRSLLGIVSLLFLVDLFWIAYFLVGRSLYELDRSPLLYNHKELILTTDGGVPEWFNYLQTTFLVLLLFRAARRTRQPIYFSLGFVYVIVVLDDALELHESCGQYFVQLLDIPKIMGLRQHDVGEVIAWAIAGAVIVPLLLFTLVRSRRLHRGNGLALLLAFGVLLFCAIVVDQLYSNFHDLFLLAGVLIDALEDGGEMLAISLACALALGALSQLDRLPVGDPGPSPCDDKS